MGIYSWDLDGGLSFALPLRSPRLTIRCEYPGLCLHPVEITFGLSRRYGIRTARDAHDWFLGMMRFVVETNKGWRSSDAVLERDREAGGCYVI